MELIYLTFDELGDKWPCWNEWISWTWVSQFDIFKPFVIDKDILNHIDFDEVVINIKKPIYICYRPLEHYQSVLCFQK
jgi:hypothetical protein